MSGRNRGRSLRVAMATMACSLLLAGSAQGATLVLGSQFQGTIQEGEVAASYTLANAALPASLVAASPTDGTVIEWRFSGGVSQSFTPRIVRPVPFTGGRFTGAGTGPAQTGAGIGPVAGPFPLNLPIKQGDLFGYNIGSGVSFGDIPKQGATLIGFLNPSLADGGAARTPGLSLAQELAVGATVRYCLVPKLKRKRPKAARRALREADCTVGETKKSKKRRKKKRVVSQSVEPGLSVSDTEPIDLKVSRKPR